MSGARSDIPSSFTLIKGSMIEETYATFAHWDSAQTKAANLTRMQQENWFGAKSASWLRDLAFGLSSRFDPDGRDKALVELAKAGCSMVVWKPLALWHIARNEFLPRDFLVNWLYPQFTGGAFALRSEDAIEYLNALRKRRNIRWSRPWSEDTTSRVANGLLLLARDLGLLEGSLVKKFASFHLPEECFLYIFHAMAETEPNAGRIVASEDWHMFLMDASDVERELLRLHQFRKLHYEVAGSLAQLKLPCASTAEYVRGLCS